MNSAILWHVIMGGHLFSDLGPVGGGQHLEVTCQRARLQRTVVVAEVLRLAEQHVLLQRGVLHPRLLRYVRHLALTNRTTGVGARSAYM